jgi:hypothetical protein
MFSSQGWQQLNAAVGGALEERNADGYAVPFKTMGIELGVDWGQMLVFSLRSTGLVMARWVHYIVMGRLWWLARGYMHAGAASYL